jgi:hypothetical protein
MFNNRTNIDFGNIAILAGLIFLWEWLGPSPYFEYAMRHSMEDHRVQYLVLFFLTDIGFAFNIYFIGKFGFLIVMGKRRWITLAAGVAWLILIVINFAIMALREASRTPDVPWQQAKVSEYTYHFVSIALGICFNYLLGRIQFSTGRRPSTVE